MILSKLHLENFKKYTAFDIEFGEGLVGIIGKNGSGKSTLFEAILFALYGEAKTRGNKELIRNANASPKDAVVVELDFEFEGVEYKVTREFRGKALTANAKLLKNAELTTTGAKEVTTAIVKLTKMSKDAFMHTLFASQKELTSLSTLKNEDRKKMIRKLLGLEKIDFIEKELVGKRTELKNEIAAFAEVLLGAGELKSYETNLEQNKQKNAAFTKETEIKTILLNATRVQEIALKTQLEAFVKTKEEKQQLSSEIELIKNSLVAETANQTKRSHELQELQLKENELKSLQEVKEQYAKLQAELKEQEKLKEFHLKKEGILKEQASLTEQWRKSKSDIAALEKECEGLEDFLFQAKNMEFTLAGLDENIKNKHTIERELQAEIAGEQKQIELTNAKILSLQNMGKESACPTCTRPLLEEYDNVINSLVGVVNNTHQVKIDEYKKQLVNVLTQKAAYENEKKLKDKEFLELTKNINIIQSKQKDLKNAVDYFKTVEQKGIQNKQELQALEQYSYDEAQHKELQNSFQTLTPKYQLYLSLETELKRLPTLKTELEATAKKILELNAAKQTKEAAFQLINYDETKHKATETEANAAAKEKEAQSTAINEFKVQIARLEGEIKTINAALQNNQTQLKKVQTKKDDLLDYEKIKTSLAEFKTKLNAKVAPRISAIASEMYARITKGKYQYIEVSNDFDFFIYDEGKKYPIERFSGGEVDLANLVLRIAISKTLTELSGASSIGFLAFDEVFGSQDEARRMEILEAFHTIKEQYRQIFLISHEMEIKEMFEVVVEL
ncbi:SMC family ATPase [bacterium]|nr:SMC family ATPase [bacterium]MBU1434630.1 SMC family ATPase [bacterium]MBU1502208.1 SMC family ATPase [bacterium]